MRIGRRRGVSLAAARVARGLMSLVAILALLGAIASFVFVGIAPRALDYRTLTILSGSMRPVFAPGDVIVVTPIKPEDVRVGQVIAFNAPVDGSPMVTHRVTKVTHAKDGVPVIRTKGDNNPTGDAWSARLDRGDVWIMRGSVPHAGTVINALRRPVVRGFALWGALGLFVLVGLRSIWSAPAKEGEDDRRAPAAARALVLVPVREPLPVHGPQPRFPVHGPDRQDAIAS